ncbi:class I SAM-dependent methyltransferase [bacterium]|jgi:2-polyprenyl-3-methyl-5-hydroxy-6-metoxy-1,4-benzoquinol methylase|nr:class I SAM-dependent methyltransferase [bacterium]
MQSKQSSYYKGDRQDVASLIDKRYKKILEIGCGDGSFSFNFNRCEYYGIEPNLSAWKKSKSILTESYFGTFEQVFKDLPDNYFDLVVVNDVIEHMQDHMFFFDNIKQKMSDGGVCIGSIPNVRFIPNLVNFIFRKDWQYVGDGILDDTHLRFFTQKSIKRIFKEKMYIEEFIGINSIERLYTSHKYFIYLLLSLIFGKDSKFMQFSFRVRIK